MLEFDLNALIWFILGAVAMLVAAFLLLVAWLHKMKHEAESIMDDWQIKIENWKATPQRLAMSERKK